MNKVEDNRVIRTDDRVHAVPRDYFRPRLCALKIPFHMMWRICTLYELVLGRVRCPKGLSDVTIGMKQRRPLTPIVFGVYISKVADYTTHKSTRELTFRFLHSSFHQQYSPGL